MSARSTTTDREPSPRPVREGEECVASDSEVEMSSAVAGDATAAGMGEDENGKREQVVNGMKPLAEGATVCFYASGSQLMIVRPTGKSWELQPLGVSDVAYNAEGNLRLQFYRPECIFVVMRKGKYYGFRSIVAEGRTLQAMQGDNVPHRVHNYNFGDWECWEQTPDGFVNVRWRTKQLGYEVREVRSVAVEDVKGAEKGHLKQAKHIQQKLRGTEVKLADSERRIQELSRTAERQNRFHQKENNELRDRLEDALRVRQQLEMEKVQLNATLKQQELRITQMNTEKEVLDTTCAQAESRLQSLHREIESARERHEAEIQRTEKAHESEIKALNREKEIELKRAIQHYEDQISRLKEDAQEKHQKKDDEVNNLKGTIEFQLKEKDFEISSLMEECSKLNNTLKVIKSQLDQARMAKGSLHAGSMRLSPVLDGRISPGGSNGRLSPELSGRRSPHFRPVPVLDGRISPAGSNGRRSPELSGRRSPHFRPTSRSARSSPIPGFASGDISAAGLNLCPTFSERMGPDRRPANPADLVDSDEDVNTGSRSPLKGNTDMTEASVWSLGDQHAKLSSQEEEDTETVFQFSPNPSPRVHQRRRKIGVGNSDESDGCQSTSEDVESGYSTEVYVDNGLVTPRLLAPQV